MNERSLIGHPEFSGTEYCLPVKGRAMVGRRMSNQFFVIQVMTGGEDRFVRLARQKEELHQVEPFRLWWLRRRLFIRRQGKRISTLASLFPGYVILETEAVTDTIFRLLQGCRGFGRFLKSNSEIVPLSANDLALVRHFLHFGEIVRESKVVFDVNNRIQVKEGPMQGLEGRIVKVDRRKVRAKVALDLYDNTFLIDFAFEVLTGPPVVPTGGASDE